MNGTGCKDLRCRHRRLVGSAIVRQLRNQGYENLLLRTRVELDRRVSWRCVDSSAVRRRITSSWPRPRRSAGYMPMTPTRLILFG